MKQIFLDIETVPLQISDETVKGYLMDKKITKEMRSLDATYSKIVLICVKVLGGDCRFFDGEEKELLKEFWDFIRKEKNFKIVTHNGYKFDVPFLNIRSLVNGVDKVDINLNMWQMENSNHFDTMLLFSQNGVFINSNLEILGRLNGIEVSGEGISGRDIERLYKEGKMDMVKEKCKRDVEILEKIYNKFFVKDRSVMEFSRKE